MREYANDHYKAEFEAEIGRLEKRVGLSKETTDGIRGLEETIRSTLTREALNVVCRQGGKADLGLVRRVLSSGFINLSVHDLHFFRKFGSWEDIPAILAAQNTPGRTGLLFSTDNEQPRILDVAKVIYKIGRLRLQELCETDISDIALGLIIGMSSSKQFQTLGGRQLSRLLHSDTNMLRKIVALKSVSALPKALLRRLFFSYTAELPYFYDIIHLLDFGITMPKEKAVSAAKRALFRELSYWF